MATYSHVIVGNYNQTESGVLVVYDVSSTDTRIINVAVTGSASIAGNIERV